MVHTRRRLTGALKKALPALKRRVRGIKATVFGMQKHELDAAAERIFRQVETFGVQQTEKMFSKAAAEGRKHFFQRLESESTKFQGQKIMDYAVLKSTQNAMNRLGIKKNREKILSTLSDYFGQVDIRIEYAKRTRRPFSSLHADRTLREKIESLFELIGEHKAKVLIKIIEMQRFKIRGYLNKKMRELQEDAAFDNFLVEGFKRLKEEEKK